MKKLSVPILLLLSFALSFGGNDLRIQGGENQALGDHSTTLVNAFSIANNQGAAAFLESPAFGLSYRSSYFPAGISDVSLAAAAPVGFGTLGGSVAYYGNSLYYEMKAGLAYAMKLGGKVGIGVQLDYLNSKARDYGGKHFVTFEVGLLYEIIDQLSIGFHLYNPVKYRVDESTDEILPVVFGAGLQYRPHEQITILAELEKDIDHPFNFKGGFKYQVIDALAINAGFSTEPVEISFGLGYSLKGLLLIDMTGNYHLDLGFQAGASLSLILDRKDEHGQ